MDPHDWQVSCLLGWPVFQPVSWLSSCDGLFDVAIVMGEDGHVVGLVHLGAVVLLQDHRDRMSVLQGQEAGA